MADDKRIIAQRIKDLIKAKSLTQAELAEKLGITQAAISQIVNAERFPTMPLLMKLARELTVSMDYLVGKTQTANPTDVATALTNDDQLLEFFRNFQSLNPQMQDLLRQQAEMMKKK
jgi:transcriptional regulator with XRE-family HTH domain